MPATDIFNNANQIVDVDPIYWSADHASAGLYTANSPTIGSDGRLYRLNPDTLGGAVGDSNQDPASRSDHWIPDQEWISLEDFGGVNDGVTDCTAAWTGAVALAKKSGRPIMITHGEWFIPPNYTTIDFPLKLYSISQGKIIGGKTINDSEWMMDIVDGGSIEVDGINFTGISRLLRLNGDSAGSVEKVHLNNIRIEDSVDLAYGVGGIDLVIDSLKITNIVIRNGYHGIATYGAKVKTAHISNVDIDNIIQRGIGLGNSDFAETGWETVSVIGCTVKNVIGTGTLDVAGIQVLGSQVNIESNILKNVSSTGTPDAVEGIYTKGNALIANNNLSNAGQFNASIVVKGDGDLKCKCIGNTVVHDDPSLPVSVGISYEVENVESIGNTVEGIYTQAAIEFKRSIVVKQTSKNDTIRNCDAFYGLYMGSDPGLSADNEIEVTGLLIDGLLGPAAQGIAIRTDDSAGVVTKTAIVKGCTFKNIQNGSTFGVLITSNTNKIDTVILSDLDFIDMESGVRFVGGIENAFYNDIRTVGIAATYEVWGTGAVGNLSAGTVTNIKV